MEAFQQRVVYEKTELDDKIAKLTPFIAGTIFNTLDDLEKSRLKVQLEIMKDYSNVLELRIAAFK